MCVYNSPNLCGLTQRERRLNSLQDIVARENISERHHIGRCQTIRWRMDDRCITCQRLIDDRVAGRGVRSRADRNRPGFDRPS